MPCACPLGFKVRLKFFNMETKKLTLYQKLLDIESKVLGLGKDKDGHGYRYVTGSKVLDYVKPLMVEHKILLKQEILSIDNERQDYTLKSGSSKSEILSKVMMRFTWVDCESGEKDENLFGANGQNDWDKGVGSALTYAERYFLLKYFHINTDEDDIDNPDRKQEDEQKIIAPTSATQQPAQPAQQKSVPAESAKKWLNLLDGQKNSTPEWADIQKAIVEGRITSVDDVRVWYKVSKEVAEKITELLQNKAA